MISRSSMLGVFPTKPLGDVVEFLDSIRRPVTESERRTGPYPYYGANGQQGTIDDFIFDEPLVLLAEDGGHFDDPERGIAYRVSGKTWVNNHAHVLRPNAEMDLAFLCRVLENYDVTPWVTGTTRGKLTQAGAAQIVVPVPPLPEQRRIAAILDKADELRAKRRAAIAQLDILTQSIFLDMFGDPATNPKGWPIRTLAQFYVNQEEGTKCGPFGSALKKSEFESDGVAVWNMDNIDPSGRMVMPFRMWISESKYRQLEAYAVANSDVIISRAGTVGKMCVASTGGTRSIISTNLIRLRFGPDLLPLYFVSLMTYCKGRIGRLKTGEDGAFTHMNTGILDTLNFPYPPLELQERYATIFQSLEKQKSQHVTQLAGLNVLVASLQHRAFRGEL
ncbi:MAG: restriction endonuclease subunit S [Nitrospira sp.]|nr:restriction endonuclease subunit S [Nitrospira sp.]